MDISVSRVSAVNARSRSPKKKDTICKCGVISAGIIKAVRTARLRIMDAVPEVTSMTINDAIQTLKDHKICFEHDFGWNRTVLEALDIAIQALTAADVVPVVRCSQCKHCVEHYDTDGNAPYWVCKEWDSGTDYDGYCHYGERMEA